jgi:sugar O-acyltransferase (sialic acid O-acetyltransferase NeuD family)
VLGGRTGDLLDFRGHAPPRRVPPSSMASPTLLVWGASGHGKVVADVAELCGYTVTGFVDDDPAKAGDRFLDLPVIASSALAATDAGAAIALGIGDNRAREAAFARAVAAGRRLPQLVHPSAVVARSARLGDAALVCAAAVVNPAAVVGTAAIVNTGAVVEHDCVIGDFAHVSPGAVLAGAAAVGLRAHVGAGAVVLPRRRVGDDAVLGAGAVAAADVPAGATVAGVPARPLVKSGERR